MSYAARIYVDEDGTTYGASQTDQRGSREAHGRTVAGKPVEYAGQWAGSQMSYKPYARAVNRAARRAYLRKHPLERLAEVA